MKYNNRRILVSRAGLQRFMNDPFIHHEIMGMVDDAELMGIDINDPEMMGGLIQNVIKKISTAVRKKREERQKNNSAAPAFSLSTPQGVASIGPGGVQWTGTQNIPIGNTGLQIAPVQQQETILDKVKSNPALLGLAALPFLFIMMNNRKRSEKK